MESLANTINLWDKQIKIEEFITLENAITYNNVIDKLLFIGESLDISPLGGKVLKVEDLLIKLLEDNGIEIK
jgi:hypothetical protein